MNFFHKNNIKINKNEYALFDTNSSAKTYIGKCFTSKIKKNWKNGIVNLINPEKILNEIEVELSISNNNSHRNKLSEKTLKAIYKNVRYGNEYFWRKDFAYNGWNGFVRECRA